MTIAPRVEDPRPMIALRLIYTAAVMAVVIWLLRSGNPVGGLLVAPAAAEAEDAAHARSGGQSLERRRRSSGS